jgi:hypothetical protein
LGGKFTKETHCQHKCGEDNQTEEEMDDEIYDILFVFVFAYLAF